MDKSRGEFEMWMMSSGKTNFSKIDDIYASSDTFFMWQAWKASRAALVVQLPIQCETTLYQGDFEDGYESGYNESLKDAKEKLLKAGIKCS